MADPLAGQAGRQRLAAPVAGLRRGRGRVRLGSRPGGRGLDDIGGEEEQLARIDGLALLAEPLAEELLELVLELGDEQTLLARGLGLLAELEMGDGQVVGERGVVGSHAPYYDDSCWRVGANRRGFQADGRA